LAAAIATIAVVATAASAALAVTGNGAHAAKAVRVVNASSNAVLGKKIVVDTRGRTLYALSPETVHHLLCKSRECFEIWPPLLVHSASVKPTAGPGVGGHLGLLRRGRGTFQVTLRGLPLYRFAGDKAGEANGEGLMTFGGTWHAVRASANAAGSPAPQAPAPAPTPAPAPAPGPAPAPMPGYGY
jgi:predicted lipoprotein with Yx(FWY)xxD motif